MPPQVKAIGDIVKVIQSKPTNFPHKQIFLLRKAWEKIGLPAGHILTDLQIKEKKLFVKLTSLSLKHYITTNHDAVLSKLNQIAKQMDKDWLNLHKIILTHY